MTLMHTNQNMTTPPNTDNNANAAIQDILEKIEARKHNVYEIRDPYGILNLLNLINDNESDSLRKMGMMRSRL
jgi:hypothetical protein